jgi:DNA-binding response OmpR family regulator
MSGRDTVLLIDDGPTRETTAATLERAEFDVVCASDAELARRLVQQVRTELVIIGTLHGHDGPALCREIRTLSAAPLILVASSVEDVIDGLEAGADDVIAQPDRRHEFVARIRAVLRRHDHLPEQHRRDPVLAFDDVAVNTAEHTVEIRGELVHLPLKQHRLLAALLRNAGRVAKRRDLLEEVWGRDYAGDTKTLDVHIKRLRFELDTHGCRSPQIVTVRGVGYKLTMAG